MPYTHTDSRLFRARGSYQSWIRRHSSPPGLPSFKRHENVEGWKRSCVTEGPAKTLTRPIITHHGSHNMQSASCTWRIAHGFPCSFFPFFGLFCAWVESASQEPENIPFIKTCFKLEESQQLFWIEKQEIEFTRSKMGIVFPACIACILNTTSLPRADLGADRSVQGFNPDRC